MARKRQLGTDDPSTYGEAFQVRWSRAPDQRKRNYGEAFHNSPAFDALNLISQDVAGAKLKVFDKKQYKRDPEKAKEYQDHPIIALLDDPCPGHKEIDGYMLKYMTTAYMSMVGEFFWVIERNKAGYPVALYPCLPTWVVQTWSVSFPMYRILPQGVTSAREILVDGDDIVWFKNPSMVDPFGRGRGRDEAIADEIESDEYAAKYQKNLFYNDGQPPMIISLLDSDEAQAANLKETWIQKFSGFMNARKPMVTNAKVEVQKLTDSVREMDMVESRKALRDIFNQHYAIPPEMRGILENSNRSTIDSADYLYKKNVLSRSIKRFLEILNRQLVPQYDDNVLLVCDDIVPEDEDKKREWAMKEFQAGLITLNEYHVKTGQNKIANGDYYLRPNTVTMVPLAEAAVSVEPPTPAPPVPVPPVPPKKSKGFSVDQKAAHWKAFDAEAAAKESGFAKVIKEIAEEQRKLFFGFYSSELAAGKSADEAAESAVYKTYKGKTHVDVFNALSPEWIVSVKAGSSLAWDTIGASVNFDLINPVLREWVKEHGLEMAKEINGTTQEYLQALKPKIAEAIQAGESMEKIATMLNDEFDKLKSSRAMLIARTETMASVNFGQFAVYKEEGIDRKEWLATLDGETRADHANMDGKIVGINEKFPNGLMFPGDSSNGVAADVCNCRCSIMPVIED